jgi:hypothetical protein
MGTVEVQAKLSITLTMTHEEAEELKDFMGSKSSSEFREGSMQSQLWRALRVVIDG